MCKHKELSAKGKSPAQGEGCVHTERALCKRKEPTCVNGKRIDRALSAHREDPEAQWGQSPGRGEGKGLRERP